MTKLLFPGITLLLLAVLSPAALGKLASSDFDSLVKESELILIAEPINIYQQKSRSGYSDMKVVEVLKGSKIKQIRIKWSSEVHDAKINDFSQHILFLKKTGGGYISAQYGKGIWPISGTLFKIGTKENDYDCCVDFIEYVYPVDLVTFKDGVVKRITNEEWRRGRLDKCNAGNKVEGIFLDELKRLIASKTVQ